jgi:predicted enzyme related to lactoylglutathione lyase
MQGQREDAGLLQKTFRLENRGDGAGGMTGHSTALGHEPHRYTIFYVDVDDVAAYLEKAKSLGGKMLVPPVEIPAGTFAWMQDPEGNTVGLWKAKK